MDPKLCCEQLGRLMAEESVALSELAVLLDREHGYLLANDVVALEAATRDRQQCVQRISRVDDERRTLCGKLDYATDLSGLEQLLRWCDPQGTLGPGWARCSAAAAHCRKLNDRNGTLVGARLEHVQARLGALIDGRRESVTYGPRGARTQTTAGRVVATEA